MTKLVKSYVSYICDYKFRLLILGISIMLPLMLFGIPETFVEAVGISFAITVIAHIKDHSLIEIIFFSFMNCVLSICVLILLLSAFRFNIEVNIPLVLLKSIILAVLFHFGLKNYPYKARIKVITFCIMIVFICAAH